MAGESRSTSCPIVRSHVDGSVALTGRLPSCPVKDCEEHEGQPKATNPVLKVAINDRPTNRVLRVTAMFCAIGEL